MYWKTFRALGTASFSSIKYLNAWRESNKSSQLSWKYKTLFYLWSIYVKEWQSLFGSLQPLHSLSSDLYLQICRAEQICLHPFIRNWALRHICLNRQVKPLSCFIYTQFLSMFVSLVAGWLQVRITLMFCGQQNNKFVPSQKKRWIKCIYNGVMLYECFSVQ